MNSQQDPKPKTGNTAPTQGAGLGTFTGVFTPSILTILGIILFLRLGFVVGNAGLGGALLIIGIATAVSLLTSISLAAIATNIEVKGGGDYYLISRTLGMEFGGALGIVLFLAQSVSIAFYAIGFGEGLAAIIGIRSPVAVQVIAALAVGALFVLAWLGADWASRFQFGVMAILIGALLSFYVGSIGEFDGTTFADGFSAPFGALPFWATFAIFFPAITGFTQGVSMSGDLKQASKSLPLGTFAAVGLSTVVYVTVAILFAGNASSQTLIDDTGAMGSIAAFGWLIDAGVIAATLSSAMASFLGAPRILQSLAADKIFPFLTPFSKGHGQTNNPRRGVLLSLVIALVVISLGDLNVIAPVVSMFFLISYGLLNYATYFEASAQSPSFRPRFRFFDRRLSLLGALGCLGVIIAINPVAGGAAVLVVFGIYQFLSSRPRPERWADSARSHYFQRAKESISAMSKEPEHDRNWRPQILAFSTQSEARARLLNFATWIEGGSGLTTTVRIIEGTGAVKRRQRSTMEAELKAEIEGLGLAVHPLVVLAPDAEDALAVVLQSYGLGPLRANTVLANLPKHTDPASVARYASRLLTSTRYDKNVVTFSCTDRQWTKALDEYSGPARIDVWWTDDASSRLALLLAYLMTRTPQWSAAEIRVVALINGDSKDSIDELAKTLDEARIAATPSILSTRSIEDVAWGSATASVVFVPMRLKGGNPVGPFETELASLFDRLPMAAGVLAATPIELSAGPETGDVALLAMAEAELVEANARLQTLEKQLNAAETKEADAEMTPAQLIDLQRRVFKARARAAAAAADVASLAPKPEPPGPAVPGG